MISGDFGPESEDPRHVLDGTDYRYISVLGSGAMGDVIEAEHIKLGSRVAVKLLKRLDLHPAAFARAEDRMRIEAQACARLDHPNLLKVLGFGVTEAGRTFLVSERLVGRTLRAELDRQGFLPVLEALTIMSAVLAGLHVAHKAGIVHRDVKPENVFLTDAPPEGGGRGVKLLDFGLAKVIDAARDPSTPAPLVIPTSTGALLGTPRFMAPEQSAGSRGVDERTDLYGVGAVLYMVIAGRAPFDHHRNAHAILQAQISEVPSPPSRYTKQDVPAELDRAILKALAKDPRERFQNAHDFRAELLRIGEAVRRASAPILSPPSDSVPPRRESTTEPLTRVPNVGLPISVHEEPSVVIQQLKTAKGTDVMLYNPRLWKAGEAYRESLASPSPRESKIILGPSLVVPSPTARPSVAVVDCGVDRTMATTRAAAARASWQRVALVAIAIVALLGLVGIALVLSRA